MVIRLVLMVCMMSLGFGGAYFFPSAFTAAKAQSLDEPLELTTPDGRAVVLYPDRTWEFKRAAGSIGQDSVTVDQLVTNPSQFRGDDIVVTGDVYRILGAYRLQTPDGQNNIVVDVKNTRRADQIKLREFFKEGGLTSSIKVQLTGMVERGTITNRFVASDIVFLN